jgi:hypothetical protein
MGAFSHVTDTPKHPIPYLTGSAERSAHGDRDVGRDGGLVAREDLARQAGEAGDGLDVSSRRTKTPPG